MFKVITLSKFLSAINLALFFSCSLFVVPEQAWAKNKNDNSNEGLPVRRVGGGTRRECIPIQAKSPDKPPLDCSSLVALIPENLVITSTESPTLLFYVPTINHPQDVQVEFVLRDNQDRLVYETTFTTSGQAGIISFQIPTSDKFKGLKTEQNYHWYLSIIYNSVDRAHDDLVEGWLRHTPLPVALASQLAQATPLEQVQIYQNNNLWHEALNTLAELKRNHPEDLVISQMWTELLQSVDLAMIAPEPLINGINSPQFQLRTSLSHLKNDHRL